MSNLPINSTDAGHLSVAGMIFPGDPLRATPGAKVNVPVTSPVSAGGYRQYTTVGRVTKVLQARLLLT